MKTTYYTATTLDGFLADEHDNLDWLLSQPNDEDGALNYGDFVKDVGAIAMGATTYQWVLDHEGGSWPYEQPAWVFTHRDLEPAADNIRLTSAPVREVHAQMTEAAGGKDLWMVGGGDLAAQFAAEGLLDEVVVYVAPVLLGAGRPLFTRPFDLELLEVHRNQAFVATRYRVVGPRPVPSLEG
jgi:dihydrofolate reductase